MTEFSPTAAEEAVLRAAVERAEAWRARGGERRLRGVVHTRSELARAMAERADAALVELGATDGLADASVHLLDPSCGTGTFLAAAHGVAAARLRHASHPWRVSGWDVDPEAVRVAQRALSEVFAASSWPLELAPCDTLAQRVETGPNGRVVVLGNPPWAARAENRGDAHIEALLEDFRRDPSGARLTERKLGVLSDAYVRFLRWACEAVMAAPRGGVVSLVMNSSFLDGPVHRGLRAALCRWFDGMSVWDLGGSALIARDGARDDNVFGVRPGVAVLTAWTHGGATRQRTAAVSACRVRGTLDAKWAALREWSTCEGPPTYPHPPHFWFSSVVGEDWPDDYVALPSLMPFHQEGVQTNRDDVVIDRSHARLRVRVESLIAGKDDPDVANAYVPSAHYSPVRAREALARAWSIDPAQCTAPLAYRPFDSAFFIPVAPLCHRPRPDLRLAMEKSGLALVTVRKDRGERPWAHALAVSAVPDNCLLSSRSSCRARAFPTHDPAGAPNLDGTAVASWAAALSSAPTAPQVVAWGLAWLMAPTYCARFDALLKQDYPRLPPPASEAEWRDGLAVGQALVDLFTRDDRARLRERVDLGHHRDVRAPWGFLRAVGAADTFVQAAFARRQVRD